MNPAETSPAENLLQDYSLIGKNSELAVAKGLAEADWYTSPISREQLKTLLTRKDGPAIRDCIIYFGLIAAFGAAIFALWGTWWAVFPAMCYALLWASASDSRWHESSHGTAFKTDWLNNALYEVASFMVLRESIPWRWSHTRHHSDTIIVGRDPEIAVPRPPDIKAMLLKCINFQAFRRYLKNIFLHSTGRVTPEEATFIPSAEYPKVFLRARIYAAIYLTIFATAIYFGTWMPFVFVLGPNLYGAWLMAIYGWTQHAGLAENVLDHRLNCRTIRMNPINRFLYWNMNYHLEHHMFPMVPYHQHPKLHELVKDDCPAPYPSLLSAYKEIIPAVFKQIKDPGYFIRRTLPATARPVGTTASTAPLAIEGKLGADGWVDVCAAADLDTNDVIRFDHAEKTYAIYHTAEGKFHATDGICTHGNTHLAGGLVKGSIVECPKHNGRFDITNGEAVRPPACVALATYPVEIRDGRINLLPESADSFARKTRRFKIKSNRYVSTFIKELVLEPEAPEDFPTYLPGQYMRLDIPAYGEISFADFEIPEPFSSVWKQQGLYENRANNSIRCRRNYSLATAPGHEPGLLKFNVRIATPPRGQDCNAGVGSSFVHNLKAGDTVTAIGPFGDFLIKDTQREMIYVGGGAGMAPLRSHIIHLLETLGTDRNISFWYGARSACEIFYEEEFREIEKRFPNFTLHIALSEPQESDDWKGPTGFIHEHLRKTYLALHPRPESAEYYLCGPPVMLQATKHMLTQDFSVCAADIAYDEF
ncbi:NADH:ubiquinone reductase (Na(+)-transporting) subunit F [Luteolibacter algae]|uniref:NADH:ubiquinone reductase (Na(+)-transporting) subunit F n=1 Tax=Luteolibacter algae TaxID=454151 RepID=A0ABW5D752_9BACT